MPIAIACLFTGCKSAPKQINSAEKPDDGPVLKRFIARTDIMVVKHFYPDAKMDEAGGQRFLAPGYVTSTPIIAYEPGKESDARKGVKEFVSASYVMQNEYSHATQNYSFLDESEAADLATALQYMEETRDAWKSNKPADDVEVTFISKDGFTVTLLPRVGADGTTIAFASGAALVSFPADKIETFKGTLDAELQTLKSHEK